MSSKELRLLLQKMQSIFGNIVFTKCVKNIIDLSASERPKHILIGLFWLSFILANCQFYGFVHDL